MEQYKVKEYKIFADILYMAVQEERKILQGCGRWDEWGKPVIVSFCNDGL